MKNEDKKCVYFMRNKSNGNVKIGMAKNILKRETSLKSSYQHMGFDPKDLMLEHTIECINNGMLESDLHKMFKEYRLIGEWFNITSEFMFEKIKNIDISLYNKIEENNKIYNIPNMSDMILDSFMNWDDKIGSYSWVLNNELSILFKVIKNDTKYLYIVNYIDYLIDKSYKKYGGHRPELYCASYEKIVNILKNINDKSDECMNEFLFDIDWEIIIDSIAENNSNNSKYEINKKYWLDKYKEIANFQKEDK